MKTCKRKPHWPVWAKYKSFDGDGRKWIYSHKPMEGDLEWEFNIPVNGFEILGITKVSDIKMLLVGTVSEKKAKKWRKSLRKIKD